MTPEQTTRFHAEALLITSSFDRAERRDAIRKLGSVLFKQHQTSAVLHQLMQSCIELNPAIENQLLGDFNGALNGIGQLKDQMRNLKILSVKTSHIGIPRGDHQDVITLQSLLASSTTPTMITR